MIAVLPNSPTTQPCALSRLNGITAHRSEIMSAK